ncbi:FtsX-like permease family protein [Georgenia sp. Z1344]|uniref:FtsX-like permease family protein n=1 Tax=Georgenia sp. Z1344 TaxID=3416706 RepID=UPI003CEB0D09
MLRLAAGQARHSVGRLAAAGLAIVLASAFLTLALLTGRAVDDGARGVLRAALGQADIVLNGVEVDLEDLSALREVDGVAQATPTFTTWVGVGAGDSATWLPLAAAPEPGAEPPVDLVAGTWPTAEDEVVLSEEASLWAAAGIGDPLEVGAQTVDSDGNPVEVDGTEVEVVGIAEDLSPVLGIPTTTIYVPETTAFELAHASDGTGAWAVGLSTQPGADEDAVASRVLDVARSTGAGGDHAVTVTADEYVDARLQEVFGFRDVIGMATLLFAGLALVVAGLVIANTFQVLVAQRARTLAMLRAVGATRRQVWASVLAEAAGLGVVASVVGAALGFGVMALALRLWSDSGRDLGIPLAGTVGPSPTTIALPVVVGTVVTVLAALPPARRASAVAPVEAMRPAQAPTLLRGSPARRAWGIALAAAGVAAMTGALVVAAQLGEGTPADSTILLMIGLLVLGVALLGLGLLVGLVFVVPLVARVLGAVLAVLSPGPARATVRLATANATRNPRRTSATTMALVIGIGLVTGVTTGTESVRASLEQELSSRFPVDVAVHNPAYGSDGPVALEEDVLAAVESVPGLAATMQVTSADLVIEVGPGTAAGDAGAVGIGSIVYGVPPEAEDVLRDGLPEGLTDESVVLPASRARELGVEGGDTVLVGLPDPQTWELDESTQREMTVVVTQHGDSPLLTEHAVRSLLPDAVPSAVWARIDDAADVEDVVTDVREAGRATATAGASVAVEGSGEERLVYDEAIDRVLVVVVGLLAVSVVIALVGVANTLSLSVVERRREIATLRAVGMTRRQVRGALATEGVLLTVVGTGVGAAFGLAAGWVGITCLLAATELATLAVPWAGLGLTLVVALVAGVVASVLPARSALGVSPVAALGAE